MIRRLVLLLAAAHAFAEAPLLHPKAHPLPFTHQGPFVSTSDGGVLCIDAKEALRSTDEGRTWNGTPMFAEPAKFNVSNERALLRTCEGVIISAWMNGAERKQPKGWHWGEPGVSWKEFVLPTYTCRSTDDGKTWEPPVKLSDPWCGCIHSLIQMRSGRIVLVGQEIIPAWRHATVMWASDDLGKTWQRGDVLDYGVGAHDHAGSIEGSIVERKDGSLYLLLRTESGYLWEATSRDGLKWEGLKQSQIASVTCCPQLARLADGRIALLWNHSPRHAPASRTSREELFLAFSNDECATWSEPVVVAGSYGAGGRVSYPYLYERRPGELWITTMQGGLRMKVNAADLNGAALPIYKAPALPPPKPGGIVMFGDSTTAPRPGAVQKVYAMRVMESLQSIGSSMGVHNAGIGGNTTRDARKRLAKDVLAHKPRVVVIQFGLNDSAIDVWKTPPATEPRVPLGEYEANLRAIVADVRKSGAKPILMTTNALRWSPLTREKYGKPPYRADAADGFEQPSLPHYNAAVRGIAAELHVPLVDVRAAYDKAPSMEALLLDGMHPNDKGHALVGDLLVPVIREQVR